MGLKVAKESIEVHGAVGFSGINCLMCRGLVEMVLSNIAGKSGFVCLVKKLWRGG